jgi:hypothetical protein
MPLSEQALADARRVIQAARVRRDAHLAAYVGEVEEFFCQVEEGADGHELLEIGGVGAAKASAPSSTSRATTRPPAGRGSLPHFDRLLSLTGIKDPSKVADERGKWEIWTVQEPDRFTAASRTSRVVLVLDMPTHERLQAIDALIPGRVARGAPLTFVIAPRVNSNKAYEQIREYFRDATIVSFPELLGTVLNRLARPVARPFHEEMPSFVDPGIAAGAEKCDSAIDVLSAFLVQEGESGTVGVLLGPAGAGKSTVAKELCRPPKARASVKGVADVADLTQAIDVKRLLVEDHHWQVLEKRGVPITADAVLKEALRENGFGRDDLDQLDVLLSNGAMTLVFDSFDEVCSHGFRISANEILERIVSLSELENSGARVLITTRPEFWERVDISIREKCATFTLLPFDERRVETFLDRRFEGESTIRNRARQVLQTLPPEIRAIPLVVAVLAEAVAGGSEITAFLEQTAAGIRRSNPLPGVARIMFFREAEKHGIPLSPNDQAKFFATLVGEYGVSLSDDDLIDAAQIEFQSLTPAEAEKLRRHFMFTRTSDANTTRYSWRYPELAQALVAEATANLLRALATQSLTSKNAVALRQFLVRGQTDFPAMIDRVGPDLQSLSKVEQQRIWAHRTQLAAHGDAQSSLFRVLIEGQRPDRDGYRFPQFLPSDGSFEVAGDYVQKGNLRKIDFRTARFANVQFRDVEIASCRFSAVTEFARCTFINCTIGRDCEALRSEAFLTSHCDENTIARSKRWLSFTSLRPDVLAKIALQRVVFKVLQAAGDSAFALGGVIAEDVLEEHVVEVLKHLYILKEAPWPIIDARHYDAARKLVRNGEMVGTFQNAFRDVATWTSRDWKSTNH